MNHVNFEIKARSQNHSVIRQILKSNNAVYIGNDHQVDTYFRVNQGRLKLREGVIENHLVYYERENKQEPKQSNVTLLKSIPGSSLKEILTRALGILVVVDKTREIYFIDNVKFHLDSVIGLGTFIEIEAIDKDGTIGREKLLEQCQFYTELFKVTGEELISESYSDLILQTLIT